MGEIRSTLDIIMEKTKDLTMSEEEKAEFQHREVAGKTKGLIQKFFDGIINLDRLRIEAASIKGENRQMFDQVIKKELINRIELEGNSGPVFTILESVTDMDTAPIREILIDFRSRLEMKRDLAGRSLEEILQEKGVSGSAVSPNLNADQEWNDYVSKLNGAFREEVERAICCIG